MSKRKGESWLYINRDVLPEIDFEAVEKATNLELSEQNRYLIKEALAEYICQTRSFENKPLAATRKRKLKEVEKACELLESFLEWDGYGILDDDEYDPLTLFLYQHVTPIVDCYEDKIDNTDLSRLVVEDAGSPENQLDVLFDKSNDTNVTAKVQLNGENVADYLALCRKNAQELQRMKSRPGRREDPFIRRCLKWLLKIFQQAGGEGRGVVYSVDGVFKGPFLTFSKMLLEETNEPLGREFPQFSEAWLGDLVLNRLRLQ